ncbi:hypothetical protein ACFLT4_06030 [Chloroflexota bacterium]
MLQLDLLVLMGMGSIFILLGLGAIIWGKKEEKSYYDALSTRSVRTDTREFMEHWPRRPQFGSLKIGGRIAIAIGALMIAVSGAFLLWG